MKKHLIGFVKYSQVVYWAYFYLGSALLRVLRCFVKSDDRLILFVAYGGRKYDDSPKAVYEAMLDDRRFAACEIVWAFNDPERFEIPVGRKIKTDTFEYFKVALKARCWVTNSSVERGLSFKGKHTFYINTWHGTPIKKMGTDIASENKSFKSKSDVVADVMLAQGAYEAEIFSRVFSIPMSHFRIVGLPRNDRLVHVSATQVAELKSRLNIPHDKTVVLYAPTFREYDKNLKRECVLELPVHFDKWRARLADKYCILFRAHYEVARSMNISDNEFIRDVSSYSDLDALMLVSDLLISDYSSIFFDYAIMNKPMLCFAFDYEKYDRHRGLYFDIRKELGERILSTEDDVLDVLADFDGEYYTRRSMLFKDKYITEYGQASRRTVDMIAENMGVEQPAGEIHE
ncbi:CDP-glycerol glycerophosphotransferase family protein [uncultured Alistipes sp.]|uniref:CDP-glycerol glycerophosphotransferase family protein n=1 Tax=uncultured Alistipes sp. TaxID=538949 RepID=UPI002613FA55|nr:CDP-glycerol glycerophosphotransferase family protein [uncultured Alistipes sp.]